MRLVNYKCPKCKQEVEELYQDSEYQELLENGFPEVECECGGRIVKWDMKNNTQVWKWNDK